MNLWLRLRSEAQLELGSWRSTLVSDHQVTTVEIAVAEGQPLAYFCNPATAEVADKAGYHSRQTRNGSQRMLLGSVW